MKKIIAMLVCLMMSGCLDNYQDLFCQDESECIVEPIKVEVVDSGSTSETTTSTETITTFSEAASKDPVYIPIDLTPCSTCADVVLKPFQQFQPNNICGGDSNKYFQLYVTKICIESSPCVLDCAEVFCGDENKITIMTDTCLLCIKNDLGIQPLQKCAQN